MAPILLDTLTRNFAQAEDRTTAKTLITIRAILEVPQAEIAVIASTKNVWMQLKTAGTVTKMLTKLKALLVLPIFLAGCIENESLTAREGVAMDTVYHVITDTVKVWADPPAAKMSMVPNFNADDAPPKLTVATWAAFYDLPVKGSGRFLDFTFTPPDAGSTVVKYGLRIEGEIDAIGLPPEMLNGVREGFDVYVTDGFEARFRAQVWGIDAEGRDGPVSLWSEYLVEGD